MCERPWRGARESGVRMTRCVRPSSLPRGRERTGARDAGTPEKASRVAAGPRSAERGYPRASSGPWSWPRRMDRREHTGGGRPPPA